MVAVSELVSGLDAELVRLGYKPSTMVWYRGCWRRLERFFASRGVQEFSLDLAMAWVDQACGGSSPRSRPARSNRPMCTCSASRRCSTTSRSTGRCCAATPAPWSRLTADGADVVARFQAWLRAAGCAASTVRTYGTVAGEFLAFTGTRGGLAGLDAGGDRRVRGHPGRLPGQDGGAEAVRGAVVPAVRRRRRAGRRRGAGGGPGGEIDAGRPGSRRYGTRPT